MANCELENEVMSTEDIAILNDLDVGEIIDNMQELLG